MTRTAVELVEDAWVDGNEWEPMSTGGPCPSGEEPWRTEARTIDAEVAALRASNAELTRKGEDLCHHHGNALLELERMRARVAELEAQKDAALARMIDAFAPNMGEETPDTINSLLDVAIGHDEWQRGQIAQRDKRIAELDARASGAEAACALTTVMSDGLRRERDELLKPRSPNALELAEEYLRTHHVAWMDATTAAEHATVRAALVAYDKRGK